MVRGVKGLLIPTMLWEELGFTYMGPVDGHNIVGLQAALNLAKGYSRKPTFLHVITTKGKGYHPAEGDAIKFHGVSPNNSAKSQAPSYSEVFGRTMLRLFREDPRLVAITAAMPEGTGLALVAQEFPERVFDVGICEQHAVTFAAGLATQGFIPIVAIYSTFLQRAYDQIIHDVCIQNLSVVFALDRAGIVGDDGKTHQGAFDLSYLSCIPNIVVASPKDENELQHLLYTAVRAGGPIAIRYPRGQGMGTPLDPELRQFPIGRGEVVREGQGLAILALGSTVAPALEAAQLLAQRGIDCAVVNARYAKPLDSSLLLEVVGRTGRALTVEENTLAGGFGSAVLGLVASLSLKGVRVECIGLPDRFVEHGSQALFRSRYGLDGEGIARRALACFSDLALPLAR
jgi:1-deoxy-D-xylulose-5-phosphate synthase